MLIKNNGKSFELNYGGKPYEIKKGENEFDNIDLVRFILSKAKRQGLNVVKVIAKVKKVAKKVTKVVAKKATPKAKKPAKKAAKKNKKKQTLFRGD